MQKLIYIANQRMPTEKAYGIQIAKMCEAFAVEADVELVIPTRRNPNRKTIFEYYGVKNNFKVKKLFAPDFYFSGNLDSIAFFIKNFFSALVLSVYVLFKEADIIFSRDELPVYFLSFFNKNLIFEAHKFSPRRFRYYRRFRESGVRMVVISSGLKEEFLKFGFKPGKILVAHDGVDLERFNIKESLENCRRKVVLPLDKRIVGYVGQLKTMGMQKGIDVLIEAVVGLRKLYPDILLVIVGGTIEDIAYYKNFSKQKQVNDTVIFMGRKNHSEIPFFLGACDILIMPFPDIPHYANYMSPLKMFEYMASGKPIVATNLPVVREVLNENNSILVVPDDSHSLIVGIDKVLRDSILAKKISEQALDDVKNYTWTKRALKILS